MESFSRHVAPAGREIRRQSTVMHDRWASLDRLTSLQLLVLFLAFRNSLLAPLSALRTQERVHSFSTHAFLTMVATLCSHRAKLTSKKTHISSCEGVQWNPPPPPSPSPKLPDAFDARDYWNGTSGTVVESNCRSHKYRKSPLSFFPFL